jgi:hypothetical protein
MKKINKIKKGVVKVFDFSKECECVVSDSYEKVVASNKFELCVLCDCIKNKQVNVEIDEVVVEKKVEHKALKMMIKDDRDAILDFIKNVADLGYKKTISIKELRDLKKRKVIRVIPRWLTRDAKAKGLLVRRGLYSLERLAA